MSNESKASKPYVGMMVHYYLKGGPSLGFSQGVMVDPEEWLGPFAATVAKINPDDTVNLRVIDEHGGQLSAQRILYQETLNHEVAKAKYQDRYCCEITR